VWHAAAGRESTPIIMSDGGSLHASRLVELNRQNAKTPEAASRDEHVLVHLHANVNREVGVGAGARIDPERSPFVTWRSLADIRLQRRGRLAGQSGARRANMDSTHDFQRAQHRRWLRVLSGLAALACATGFGFLLYQFDREALVASLRTIGPIWPGLLLLESMRVVCEVLATRAVLGPDGARLPFMRLIRGQLLAQMLDIMMPAGRTSAETAKAVLYSREIGWPRAAAVATALQLAVLSANALWAIASYFGTAQLGLHRTLRIGLLNYTAITCALVLGIATFAAAKPVRRMCERMPLVHASLAHFAELLTGTPRRLVLAVCAQLLSRCVQALQLTLTLTALGAHPSLMQAYLAQAIYLLGIALGEFMPAQLGTTDAVFVLAAPALGISDLAAFSATLAMHAVQVIGALSCGAASGVLWWFESRRAAEHAQVDRWL
jgi:hypothetical protein